MIDITLYQERLADLREYIHWRIEEKIPIIQQCLEKTPNYKIYYSGYMTFEQWLPEKEVWHVDPRIA